MAKFLFFVLSRSPVSEKPQLAGIFKFSFVVLFAFGNCRPVGATAPAGRKGFPWGKALVR